MMHLGGVAIGARDLTDGRATYERLLGIDATLNGDRVEFSLSRGRIVLMQGPPGLRSLQFHDAQAPVVSGVPIDEAGGNPATAPPDAPAIDHIVIRSTAPDRAIATWRDRLGFRLALDRTFPERSLRLLFFRSGGMTLEYAVPHPLPDEPAGEDALWGVSYRVADLEAHRARLLAAGVDVSEIRKGMRPATKVCTVRSHTLDVPTLLLQETGPAVRVATADDYETVRTLWEEVFPETRAWNTAAAILARRVGVPGNALLVAERHHDCLGAVMTGWDGHRGWIYHLAVRPEARRAGVGTTLMRQAERELRAAGCPKINLQIVGSDAGNITFYERLGYAIEPRTSMGKALSGS